MYDGPEEILQIPCVHVVIATTLEHLEIVESLDDLMNVSREKHVGGEPAKQNEISDDDIFWAHCSNIEYWFEAGLPPEGLASNLSVPILRAFAGRDPQLANQLAFVVEEIVDQASQDRKVVILERYGSLLPGAWWEQHIDFIQSASPDVLLAPARDPHSPPELLERLARHPEPRIRNAVATNRDIPPSVAHQLTKDPFVDVRYALARNPKTPPEILLEFAHYRHILMRESVANNPSAPVEALAILLENSGFQLQQTILKNPACTQEFLAHLVATNPSNEVKQMALSSLQQRFQKSKPS